MKRSPMKPGTSILKRTGIRTGTIARKLSAPVLKPAKKSRLRSKGPKMTPIRKSANGEACTLRFACCNWDPATTVWCHSNAARDGKGMGIKARDEEGAYGCSACHAWLDGGYAGHMSRLTVDAYFDLARAESQAILRRKGLKPVDINIKSGAAPAVTSAAPIKPQGENFE